MKLAQSLWSQTTLVCVGVLFAFSLCLYWPSVHADFVTFDDDINIYLNENLGTPTWDRIQWMIHDVAYVRRYVPLSWLTFSGIIAAQGFEPSGFHFAGILLHSLNVVLLFLVALRVCRRLLPAASDTLPVAICAVLAFWWGVSPLRVEVVSWASGILYSLALLLFLASFHVYLSAENAEAFRKQTTIRAFSALLYLGSLFSYPVMIGGLIAFILYEAAFQLRNNPAPDLKSLFVIITKRMAVFVAFAALDAVVTIVALNHATSMWSAPLSETWYVRWIELPYFLGHYVVISIWPSNLSPVYDDLIAADLRDPGLIVVGIGFLVLLCGAAWKATRGKMMPLGCLVAYTTFLLPTAGLFEAVRVTSDRYAYGVSAFAVVVVAYVLVAARRRAVAFGVTAVILIWTLAWIPATLRQQSYWQNTDTLLTRALVRLQRPVYIRGAMVRRLALYRALSLGEFDSAIRLIDGEAGRTDKHLDPHKLSETRLYLREKQKDKDFVPDRVSGLCLIAAQNDVPAHKYGDAILRVEQALRWSPNCWNAHLQCASLLLETGRAPESVKHFQKALEINPQRVSPYAPGYLQQLKAATGTVVTQSLVDTPE